MITTGALVELVNEYPVILPPIAIPVPLVGWEVVIPAGVVRDQENVVPERLLASFRTKSVLELPEQSSCGVRVATTGSEFTLTLCDVVAGQPPGMKPLVTVRVTV